MVLFDILVSSGAADKHSSPESNKFNSYWSSDFSTYVFIKLSDNVIRLELSLLEVCLSPAVFISLNCQKSAFYASDLRPQLTLNSCFHFACGVNYYFATLEYLFTQ